MDKQLSEQQLTDIGVKAIGCWLNGDIVGMVSVITGKSETEASIEIIKNACRYYIDTLDNWESITMNWTKEEENEFYENFKQFKNDLNELCNKPGKAKK